MYVCILIHLCVSSCVRDLKYGALIVLAFGSGCLSRVLRVVGEREGKNQIGAKDDGLIFQHWLVDLS